MMGQTHLKIQDDVPDKVKNNRRDAISNTRGIDAKQLHLRDNREEMSFEIYFFYRFKYNTRQNNINVLTYKQTHSHVYHPGKPGPWKCCSV